MNTRPELMKPASFFSISFEKILKSKRYYIIFIISPRVLFLYVSISRPLNISIKKSKVRVIEGKHFFFITFPLVVNPDSTVQKSSVLLDRYYTRWLLQRAA